jgi:hypothetical protein
MLNRVLIGWIVYAGIMGFAVGGSFVAAYQIPFSQHETSTYPEQGTPDQNTKEKSDEALARYTWWLTVFTGVMAFATVGLGIATIGLYATGEKQIEVALKAANAADLSARAAIALQLPIIGVQANSLGHGESTSGKENIEDCYVHSVIVANLGDTKAFPKEVLFGWTAGETLPDQPRYQFVAKFPQNCILQPNQLGLVQSLSGSLILKEGQWTKICGGNYLWFYCAILYEDFMGETRSHGFCWLWGHTGTGMGWRVEKAAAYNKKNAALSEPPKYP